MREREKKKRIRGNKRMHEERLKYKRNTKKHKGKTNISIYVGFYEIFRDKLH